MKNKLRLLHVFDYLMHTSESQCITTKQILDKLESIDIIAERKAVLRDIQALQEFGFDIVLHEDNKKGWYLRTPILEIWELKYLIDAIGRTQVLTYEQKTALADKLMALAPVKEAKAMKSLLDQGNRKNVSIPSSLTVIQQAIAKKRQIRFQYADAGLHEEVLRAEGKWYTVNPYLMRMQYDNYYLIANTEPYGNLSHYRIDRMKNVQLLSCAIKPLEAIFPVNAELELKKYINETVYIFSGERVTVVIDTTVNFIDRIRESFGQNTRIESLGDHLIRAYVKTRNSEGLYFWLFQHLPYIKVIAPQEVKDEVIARLKRSLKMHQEH